MVPPLRTHVSYRHDRAVGGDEERRALSREFRSQVPVRPARLVLEGHPQPRTAEIAEWIRSRDPRRAEDRGRPPNLPFVYRGYVAAPSEGEQDVAVHLWEEPSGRPLDADLPRAWFQKQVPHKGMPFRLVTWMVEDDAGTLEPRGLVERLVTGGGSGETGP